MAAIITSNSLQLTIAPRATISAVPQAGGWGHERTIIKMHVAPNAMSALSHSAMLGLSKETAESKSSDIDAQESQPQAMPIEWPRMIDLGAAGAENGRVNRMNAEGASDGKSNGRPLSHAATEMISRAAPPSTAATTATTFFSSNFDKSVGMLSCARSNRQRDRREIRRAGVFMART